MPDASPDILQRIRLVCETLLCASIGDETAYVKNLRKLSAANTEPAPALLSAYEWAHGLRGDINQRIADVRSLGADRLANLLTAVIELPNFDAFQSNVWGTCCVTGVVSAHTIIFTVNGQTFCVDARFEYFLCALWVTANFCALERSRVLLLMDNLPSTVVSERVAAAMQADKQDMERVSVLYARAACLGSYDPAIVPEAPIGLIKKDSTTTIWATLVSSVPTSAAVAAV